MRPDTASRIAGIARDRKSGAAELALRAAEALSLAHPDEIAEAAQAVLRAQPAMASIYNAAQAALAGDLPAFTDRLRRSAGIIAQRTAYLVRGRTVLTHSRSSTVLRALRQGRPARVICTESLPGGEGRETAAELGGLVVPDDKVFAVLANVDVVVVGADAVTQEHVVNKVGTAEIALAARERGVPAYVLCGSDKYVPSGWHADLGGLFEATPRAWFTAVIDDKPQAANERE